jgi:alanyl-tRNA synthetase
LDKIIINEDDVKNILQNSFYDVLNDVFARTIYNFNEIENPIFAFVQKPNVFYIYDTDGIWIELTKERLIKFLNKIHMKIFKEFTDWKKIKANEIKNDSSLSSMCDKTLVKIMSVEFKQESILSKVRSMMFAKMKTDMKALVEFEFEF